jgi:hypothetical protein
LFLGLLLLPAIGQQRIQGLQDSPPQRPRRDRSRVAQSTAAASIGEFTFVRTIYDSAYSPYGRRRGGTWSTDYPEADDHFIVGLREWAGTNLNISTRPEQIPIMDDRLFDYPLIYFVEPGFMELSDEQAKRLREYVMRGGFLFFDDFWGVYEWENLVTQLKKVLPECEIKDLPLTHPIFHSYLDVEEVVQVPNVFNAMRGQTSEKGGVVPHYMGIQWKDGRLAGFVSFNCDLGDAWEWIDDPRYPVKYGLQAYKVGINVVIYAMSH